MEGQRSNPGWYVSWEFKGCARTVSHSSPMWNCVSTTRDVDGASRAGKDFIFSILNCAETFLWTRWDSVGCKEKRKKTLSDREEGRKKRKGGRVFVISAVAHPSGLTAHKSPTISQLCDMPSSPLFFIFILTAYVSALAHCPSLSFSPTHTLLWASGSLQTTLHACICLASLCQNQLCCLPRLRSSHSCLVVFSSNHVQCDKFKYSLHVLVPLLARQFLSSALCA